MKGWREALEAAGIEPEVATAWFRPSDEVEVEARKLLDRPDRPTAVLCFSDAYAMGVLNVARSLGLRVPEDLSIIGYDDSPVATAAHPQLTTVHQEVATKGHEAVRALMTAMDKSGSDTPERIMLPTRLVVRESTAPPA